MMPEMDGYATTEAVRRIPRFADLPVIAVTARAPRPHGTLPRAPSMRRQQGLASHGSQVHEPGGNTLLALNLTER